MADTPYEIDIPVVAGNVARTLANLTALRAEIMASPKPSYNVHGHQYDWVGFYQFLSLEIDNCMKQLGRFQPFEFVSAAR
jgi:hypothetical protein